MINIKNLIEFLPFYYKDKDTYKDKDDENKGILEKFLDICGDYFTNIKSVVDNSLDIIDIETTSQEYLRWLWDMLGQIPFAQQPGKAPINLSEETQRSLIKYSNSFIKIRGTKQFFEILFRLYDMNVAITEISEGEWSHIYPYMDEVYADNSNIPLDEYYQISQCLEVKFNISGTYNDIEKKAIENFIKKYVPYNVIPRIYFNGILSEDVLYLTLEVWKGTTKTWEIVASSKNGLSTYVINNYTQGAISKFRVRVWNADTDTIEYNRYFESHFIAAKGSNLTVEDTFQRFNEHIFYVRGTISGTNKLGPDIYSFNLPGSSNKVQLEINASQKVQYSYTISTDKKEYPLSKIDDNVTVKVTSIRTEENLTTHPLVICIETGEVKTPDSTGITTWTFNTSGTYTFAIYEALEIRASIKVVSYVPIYQAGIRVSYMNTNIPNTTPSYNAATGQVEYTDKDFTKDITISAEHLDLVRVITRITSSDPNAKPIDLTYRIPGKDNNLHSNLVTWIPPTYGVWRCIPTAGIEGQNTIATLTVTNPRVNTYLRFVSSNGTINNPASIDNDTPSTFIEVECYSLTDGSLYREAVFHVIDPDGNDVLVTSESTNLYKGSDIVGSVKVSAEGKIRITATNSGIFRVYEAKTPNSILTWEVTSNKYTVDEPNGAKIIPQDVEGWSGSDTAKIYQLSPENTEARYKLVFTKDGEVLDCLGSIQDNEGNRYDPDEIYTETSPIKKTFKFECLGKSFTCTLEVKDFVSEVILTCTPKSALFINYQAQTKLKISSNKSSEILQILCKETGDYYDDGNTFTAISPGIYHFVPIVEGNIREGIEATFEALDPSYISLDKEELVWEADDLSTQQIELFTHSQTSWEIKEQ